MTENSILFKLLTSEESCVISGGISPFFVPHSTQEGSIRNVDGNGREVKLSTTGQNTTNNSNNVDPMAISLIAQTNSGEATTTTTKMNHR